MIVITIQITGKIGKNCVTELESVSKNIVHIEQEMINTNPTDLNYASTINVDRIRTDILEGMLDNMHNQMDKIREEMVLVEYELFRRKYGDKK